MECEHEKKLKFKIPKLESSAVDEEGGGSSSSPDNVMISKSVFCGVCNKGFETGKALGGHMRIHPQSTKKHQGLSIRNQPIFKNHHRNQSRSGSENSMLHLPVSCCVCLKEFSTMKSLFGHMRCHPGRNWRGIRPPPLMNTESFSDDDDMVVDCSQSVPKWSVKARRGKKAVKSDVSEVTGSGSGSYEDLDEEMMLRNAVNDLMLLKHIDSDSSGLSTLGAVAQKICDGVDEQNHENGNSWTVNSRGDELDHSRFVGNGFEQVGKVNDYPVTDHVMRDYIGFGGQEGNVVENHGVAEDEFDGMNTELVLGSKPYDGVSNIKDDHGEMVMGESKNNKVKARKVKMMMDLNQEKPVPAVGGSGSLQAAASIAIEKFKCSTCNKCFSTHQALGGHRSSHNKFKITVINGIDGATNKQPSSVNAFAAPDQSLVKNEEFNQSQQQLQLNRSEECAPNRISIDEVGGGSKADYVSSTVHQCSVCYKIFQSGQALGGHKRCHWTAPADGPTEAQAQPQAQLAVRSAGEEASTQAGGRRIRLMGFDVNVPASMVDDAQVGGAVW